MASSGGGGGHVPLRPPLGSGTETMQIQIVDETMTGAHL